MFIKKKTYTYEDIFGEKHKLKVSPKDIVCIPYETDQGMKSLRDLNLCKLLYWETYNGKNLQSMSIICPYEDDLIGKHFTQAEICQMAISEDRLRSMMETRVKDDSTKDEFER